LKKLLIVSIIGTLLVQGIGKVPAIKAEIIMENNGHKDCGTGNIVEKIRYEKKRLYIDNFEMVEGYIKYCEENGFTDELINQYWLGGNPSSNVKQAFLITTKSNEVKHIDKDGKTNFIYSVPRSSV
ncbi:MAG: hypothetical protein K2K35_01550, partial [Lachnospiraceae bacterium]|nr:hypothetical protein [Lachnospiraceae bacterium]